MKKRKQMSVFAWFIIFILLIALVMSICYLISRHFSYSYMHVLENTGMVLMVIGGLSVMGDLSIRSNVKDNQTKLSKKWSRGLTEDIKLAEGSRTFFVILAIAGLLLLVTPVIFNIR